MRAYVTEFIGTYFLVLTVGFAVLGGTPFAGLAIGASLMVMVYMGGHISGAHYNPAVSVGCALRKKLPWSEVPPYIAAQLAGAVAAALTVRGILGQTFTIAPAEGIGATAAIAIEALYTFALALVVLNVATIQKTKGNSFYGLAIGFTVVAGAFAVGAISGGAFNPAVTLGAAVMDMFAWPTLWVYLVAQALAGVAAGVTFLALNPDDK